MKPIRVYEYPKCSTCKKALKFLAARNIAHEKVDITLQPPTKLEIEKMIDFCAGDFKKLFNTSGEVYRAMKLSERIGQLTKAEAIRLLSSNGKLIKRPFVLLPSTGLVGFNESLWEKAF